MSEDWDAYADRIGGTVAEATAKLQGAMVNLPPTYKEEYLEQLLAEAAFSDDTRQILETELSATGDGNGACSSSSPTAPYYWVNQSNNPGELEEGYLQAPPDDLFSHDVGKLERGDIVFNFSDGHILGYSEVTQPARRVEVDGSPKCRVKVEMTRFEEPLEFVDVFEYLQREDVRLDEYYPVNPAGINQQYLYNLSAKAGEYLLEQGTNRDPHPLIDHIHQNPGVTLHLFGVYPSDWLTILRRGALHIWEDLRSDWVDVKPGDVVIFRILGPKKRKMPVRLRLGTESSAAQ